MVTVHVENCMKKFGDFVAVSNASFVVDQGEILTLLGPSGSGKSTILRMLAGLIMPDAGQIFFGETDVTYLPPQQRNTAMVFQNYALFPHMNVRKNVEYGLTIRKVPKEEKERRVKDALTRVAMEQLMNKMPGKLSGGQQQRVAVARALVVNPDLLLLDEPLSNLDAKLRVETRQEIRDLVKELDLTAIFVTHDQVEALSISDRIAVMDIGYIRQIGTPKEIWETPETAFVGSFIGEANTIDMVVDDVVSQEILIKLTNTSTEVIRSAYFKGTAQAKDPVRVVIRPERIKVKTKDESHENALKAKVRTVMFFGSHTHIVATLENKSELIIYEDAGKQIKRHQEIFLDIHPKDIRVFTSNNF
jgi:ABC-type Fe3+/spermidine/putrescine transport system ATPase subunit